MTILTFAATATGKSWKRLRLYSVWAHLVPDADVGPFGQQQLHLVHVLVFRRPDDGCPSSVILVQEKTNYVQLMETGDRAVTHVTAF